MPDITTCLWYDDQGREAAELYTSIFPNSTITGATPYPESHPEDIPKPDVRDMVVTFELDGHKYVALNGGPQFKFNEAISIQVHCESQEEVDRYWDALVADGGEEGPCGWLKDKFGLSWQITPTRLLELISDDDPEVARRAADAMYKMRKIDIATIEAAAAGETVNGS